MAYTEIQNIPVFGEPLDNAVEQIIRCSRDAERAALMADHPLLVSGRRHRVDVNL